MRLRRSFLFHVSRRRQHCQHHSDLPWWSRLLLLTDPGLGGYEAWCEKSARDADEQVVARDADEQVVARDADEQVVARDADEQVIAREACLLQDVKGCQSRRSAATAPRSTRHYPVC